MRRHALGILAFVLLVAGLVQLAMVGITDSQASMIASLLVRSGLVFGAIWLAFPQVTKLMAKTSPALLTAILIGAGIIIARPRTVLVVAPLLAIIGLVHLLGRISRPAAPRKRRSGQSQRATKSAR